MWCNGQPCPTVMFLLVVFYLHFLKFRRNANLCSLSLSPVIQRQINPYSIPKILFYDYLFSPLYRDNLELDIYSVLILEEQRNVLLVASVRYKEKVIKIKSHWRLGREEGNGQFSLYSVERLALQANWCLDYTLELHFCLH